MKKIYLTALIVFVCIASHAQTTPQPSNTQTIAAGLGLFAFPANNQTPEKQGEDEIACYQWAMQQTGYNPTNPPQIQAKQADTSLDGSAVGGAARGAAAGAAIGAIAGDAGKGAAIGAVAGGLRGRRARIAGDQIEQQQNNQAAAAEQKALLDNFKKAFTACMEGKGYTVK